MAGFLSKIFSSGVGDAVEKVGGVLDKFITTKEEKAEALNAIRKLKKIQLNKFRKDGTLKSQYRKAGGVVMRGRGGTFKGTY